MVKLKHREKVRMARRMMEGMPRRHWRFFGYGIFNTPQWDSRRAGIAARVAKTIATMKKMAQERRLRREKVAKG